MYSILFVSCPDQDVAADLAERLLEKRLVACASIIGRMESRFWWNGKVQRENEFLMILKTREELFETIEAEIAEHHPYEVPEIVMARIEKGHLPYLEWIQAETIGTKE